MKPLGSIQPLVSPVQPVRPKAVPSPDPAPLDFERMGRIQKEGPVEAVLQTGFSQARVARVYQAGGALTQAILHPACKPFEQLYRVEPTDAMFDPSINPESPVLVELGAYKVPAQMVLFLFDTRADIYVPDGVIPNDCREIEDRRLSRSLGWYVSVNGTIPMNGQYQIEPLPATAGSQAFVPSANASGTTGALALAGLPAATASVAPAQLFTQARGRQFAQSGPGLALQPQRTDRLGARNLPFMWIAEAGDTVRAQLFVFRPLGTPVCFFEYDIAGLLLPANWAKQLVDVTRPGDLIP